MSCMCYLEKLIGRTYIRWIIIQTMVGLGLTIITKLNLNMRNDKFNVIK